MISNHTFAGEMYTVLNLWYGFQVFGPRFLDAETQKSTRVERTWLWTLDFMTVHFQPSLRPSLSTPKSDTWVPKSESGSTIGIWNWGPIFIFQYLRMRFFFEFSAKVYGYCHSVLDKIWIKQLLIHGVEIKIGLKI